MFAPTSRQSQIRIQLSVTGKACRVFRISPTRRQCGVSFRETQGAVWRKRTLPRHSRHHSQSCETARKGLPALPGTEKLGDIPYPVAKGQGL